jgi:hypothetical protein
MQAQPTNSAQLTVWGRWVIAYGAFLIIIGLLGYASNPAQAKTALISGGSFGTLNLLFGLALLRGFAVFRGIAIGVAATLSLIFIWRSTVSWLAFAAGEPKLIAAVLISSMLLASLSLIFQLLRPTCQAISPAA